MKKKPTLNVSLDCGWVEGDHSPSGTLRRDWVQRHDERLERAYQAKAESRNTRTG